jgi:hypothetical protein
MRYFHGTQSSCSGENQIRHFTSNNELNNLDSIMAAERMGRSD